MTLHKILPLSLLALSLTAYGNNATIMVKEGQKVKRGQQIATMGNTDATQTQLHFEVRENGTAVDPTKFIP